jgi:hypothetical protein
MRDTRAVHGVPRSEVVGAIQDDVALRGEMIELVGLDARGDGYDVDIGIDRAQRARRGIHFLRTDGLGAIEDLALQVGEIDFVRIGDGETADAGGSEIKRGRAAEAARADD